jgi:hypothetical protein
VLASGGRLVFNVASPVLGVCFDDATGGVTPVLRSSYFGLAATPQPAGDEAVSYQLSYGKWLRTLRAAGLVADDVIEPRERPGQSTRYYDMSPPDAHGRARRSG